MASVKIHDSRTEYIDIEISKVATCPDRIKEKLNKLAKEYKSYLEQIKTEKE